MAGDNSTEEQSWSDVLKDTFSDWTGVLIENEREQMPAGNGVYYAIPGVHVQANPALQPTGKPAEKSEGNIPDWVKAVAVIVAVVLLIVLLLRLR